MDIERHLAQQRVRHAHAVAAQPVGSAQPFTRAAPHRMEGAVGDGDDAGAPRFVRVEHPVMHLHHGRPLLDARGVGGQQVGRDLGVGVDHRDRVRETVGRAARDAVLQRIPLAAMLVVVAFDHFGARGARQRRRIVGAIVGDDDDAVVLARPVDGRQAAHRALDHRGLVVRRHQDVEAHVAPLRLRPRQARRQQRQQAQIGGGRRDGQGDDEQDQVQEAGHVLKRTLGAAQPVHRVMPAQRPRYQRQHAGDGHLRHRPRVEHHPAHDRGATVSQPARFEVDGEILPAAQGALQDPPGPHAAFGHRLRDVGLVAPDQARALADQAHQHVAVLAAGQAIGRIEDLRLAPQPISRDEEIAGAQGIARYFLAGAETRPFIETAAAHPGRRARRDVRHHRRLHPVSAMIAGRRRQQRQPLGRRALVVVDHRQPVATRQRDRHIAPPRPAPRTRRGAPRPRPARCPATSLSTTTIWDGATSAPPGRPAVGSA
ncbi:hypothetical protein BBAD15_g12489 [Beauveria bassiana D1-5]|uniref:Uncharacterized protein n=1 Tax=Beauveria bassiana D1-5 TaxID=1245745 RepID=A0A0A2V7K6_BEABA|nr:hypothetical protein BBAD15_g12489 [Beauveria bassiana D1-5]